MYDTPRTVEELLTMLAGTPPHLAGLSQGLPPDRLQESPEPREWSARDVLAHLRSCSDVWGKYILLILCEDRPTFKAVNPTTWIKQTNYREQGFQASLQAFNDQRAGLLAVLKPLGPEGWSRLATVTGAGKPRQRSVYTYAQWLANHERSHFRQMEAIVKAVRASRNTQDRSVGAGDIGSASRAGSKL